MILFWAIQQFLSRGFRPTDKGALFYIPSYIIYGQTLAIDRGTSEYKIGPIVQKCLHFNNN